MGRSGANGENTKAPVIALVGNPNVGKSTVFNALTGSHQHTGNWPGKTVMSARGEVKGKERTYSLVDLPGTYSLSPHSAEEEVTRDFLLLSAPAVTVVVCDATALERNLNLLLQVTEISPRVVLCVNLMDEAARKGIRVDTEALSRELGIPVVGTSAKKKKSLAALMQAVEGVISASELQGERIENYEEEVEEGIRNLSEFLEEKVQGMHDGRWTALHLLGGDASLENSLAVAQGTPISENPRFRALLREAKETLYRKGVDVARLPEKIARDRVRRAERIARRVISYTKAGYAERDRKWDSFLTGKKTAYVGMLSLLALTFYITIEGANVPSALLSRGFSWLEGYFRLALEAVSAPDWLIALLTEGMFRTLGTVVAVMLPPMAIFFPLFSLLEDVGYLPRIAYNLDRPFARCRACGKQALTMCMGFGCNAAGVTGARIIDSPRERMLAILTNNFVPCNGRFPTLTMLITLFFVGEAGGVLASFGGALLFTGTVLLGIGVTFLVTRILSGTLLKGMPSSFTLELPPYRKPDIGAVLVRSFLDRTLFVLGRAVSVAAPAGILLWLMANLRVGDTSVLLHAARLLEPMGQLMGLDGVILLAFLLGFPANEIVMPIVLMGYMATGSLSETASIWEMKKILVANGWEWTTAVSMILFSLFHFPCSTTLWTVKKETGSFKWTLLAAALPTAVGVLLTILFTFFVRIF